MELIKSFTKAPWSGGVGTQLYIYPTDATLAQMDFAFRLSLATIEQAHTNFTPLPDVKRSFLLLEGSVALKHENLKAPVDLKPFEIDYFNGEVPTESFGTGTAFNVMALDVSASALYHHSIYEAQTLTIKVDSPMQQLFVYLQKGSISVVNPEGTLAFAEKELLVSTGETLRLKAMSDCDIVLVRIDL